MTNLGRFDSILPDDSIQKLSVERDAVVVEDTEENMTFVQNLFGRNVISAEYPHLQKRFELSVSGAETNKHSLADYSHILGSASYYLIQQQMLHIVVLYSFNTDYIEGDLEHN